jgi:hypothetical protein
MKWCTQKTLFLNLFFCEWRSLFRRDVLTPQFDLRDGNEHVSSKPGRRWGIKIGSPENGDLDLVLSHKGIVTVQFCVTLCYNTRGLWQYSFVLPYVITQGDCDSTVLRKVRLPGLWVRLGLKKQKVLSERKQISIVGVSVPRSSIRPNSVMSPCNGRLNILCRYKRVSF